MHTGDRERICHLWQKSFKMVCLLRMAAGEQGKLNTGMRQDIDITCRLSLCFLLGVRPEQNSRSLSFPAMTDTLPAKSGLGWRMSPDHAHGREGLFPTESQGWAQGPQEALPIKERQFQDNRDDLKLWLFYEQSPETVACSSREKKKMKEFLKVGKNGLSSCFYLQQVSTADWASPLVLVVAPPPWEPPQGCLLGEKHSAAVAVLLALSPAAQQL